MTKYLVVGSPGNYILKRVEKGDKDYESGMIRQAAQETADSLNAKARQEKEVKPQQQTSPTKPFEISQVLFEEQGIISPILDTGVTTAPGKSILYDPTTGKEFDVTSLMGEKEKEIFTKYLDSVNKNQPIKISDGEAKRLLNSSSLQDVKTQAKEIKSISDQILSEINKDIEKAGGAMTPEIIERLKNRNKEADKKATEIIKNLGINPNSQEGKAFAEGLKVGGEKAVEELFGKNRQPGTPMKAPSGAEVPKFGWDEAKNFGVEYEIPEGSGTGYKPPTGGGTPPTGEGTPPPSGGTPPPDQEPPPPSGESSPTGSGEQQEGNAGDIYDFLNIPEGAYLWNVDGTNYIVYEVPGSNGELYEGNPIFMAYEVQENDIVKAGIYSPEAPALTGAPVSKVFFDKIAIVTGNTDQLSADIDNPFASFVETIGEQALVAPWIKDPEMISLIAEAAVEGRVVTDAEWQVTSWYQEHNDSEREWLRTYYSDPSTAAQLTTDAQLAVANSLQASGVSNAPEALINWVAGRYVSGEWSDAYTTEQIALFADPYAQGKRDAQFETYLSSTAITGVDRTTAREREVEELFATWLGPTLGKLTDQEKAEMAGKLRDDPDYKDTLIGSLKQSRLAAFSNYTNPELTYDDIARPWRNLTTSVWGQTADETQGWWQEMVKSNDFATAQTTLREKGLENNITQVTQDATQALTQALGEGLATQGVNQ